MIKASILIKCYCLLSKDASLLLVNTHPHAAASLLEPLTT
jgi:hypothetical protein